LIDDPYYFAGQYHSWHGSPSRMDSEVPFIVSRAHADAAKIGALVRALIGEHPRLQKVSDVILRLRVTNQNR
jgi:hypothetical protein